MSKTDRIALYAILGINLAALGIVWHTSRRINSVLQVGVNAAENIGQFQNQVQSVLNQIKR